MDAYASNDIAYQHIDHFGRPVLFNHEHTLYMSNDPDTMDMEMYILTRIFNNTHLTPFLTRSGAIGLGPATVEPGDTVAIMSGTEAPIILRPKIKDR